MRSGTGNRWAMRVQNALFALTFLGLIGVLAWLSNRDDHQWDWTAGKRNTISEQTRELLEAVDGPVEILAVVADDDAVHHRIRTRIKRLQRYKPDIELRFLNPDLEPERARALGASGAGQLVIRTDTRREVIDDLSEQTLANALQRLARGSGRWAVFLEGHGERSPESEANIGAGQLAAELERSGFAVHTLNLVRTPVIPDNTALLVIASPQTALLPGEADSVLDYVARGGNLLWLLDPGGEHGLDALAGELGLATVPGIVVDANAELRRVLGISHPAVVPVVDYPDHVVTSRIKTLTLFPYAVALKETPHGEDDPWTRTAILKTLPRAWSETGDMTGSQIGFSTADGDTAGPLVLGYALTRKLGDATQRVVVVGDSDFLANGNLGAGANLNLAVALFNWLSADDRLISIVPRSAPDTRLDLSQAHIAVISIGTLFLLPGLLVLSGALVWVRRRRR